MAVLAEGLALQASPLRHPPRCLQTLELGGEASAWSPPPPSLALLRATLAVVAQVPLRGRQDGAGRWFAPRWRRTREENEAHVPEVSRPRPDFIYLFRVSGKKSEGKEAKKSEEPRLRKKPGPKPGWKAKLRCER